MSLFHIANLASAKIKDSPAPWEAKNYPRPRLRDKDEYRHWCSSPSTEHYFYSAFEGLNPGTRIAKENPPYRQHGLVADYDSRVTRDEVKALIRKNAPPEFRPTWISTTFSGGTRLVWEFDQPVFCYSATALKAFLTRLKSQFKLGKLCPGLDDCVLRPDQMYELGTEWERVTDIRVPKKVLDLWIYECGTKAKWSGEGTEIPIELVAEEVEKQFPGRWKGEFVEGARGPRFFDPTADNDTAAIVRSSGLQCFTGDVPFVTWGQIFGASFTREFQADRVAAATDQIYYDNRHYWQKDDRGDWFSGSVQSIQLHLRVKAGLSSKAGRETCSEVDKAVYHVQCHNRVVAALPFVHQQKGLHRSPDGLYLNISNVSVCAPAEGARAWGEDFPWLAGFLDGFFSSPEQNDYFLAWLQRCYVTAYQGNMEPGQTIFVAGKVKQGKTLLGTKIIGPMLGGAVDATSYLLGRSAWNSSLFERAVWNVDDPEPGKDRSAHATYSANLKKHVANREFDFQQKFRDGARVTWTGRTIVTLNDDEVSLGMLPEMDMSVADKIMLFRAADRRFDFTDAEKHIRGELPFFCGWLKDWVAPAYTQGDYRYGVKEYHEPTMLAAAQERGTTHEYRELLEAFLIDYFRDRRDENTWEGNATSLFVGLTQCLPELARKTNAIALGRFLKTLLRLGDPNVKLVEKRSNRSHWIIRREMIGDLADEKPGER